MPEQEKCDEQFAISRIVRDAIEKASTDPDVCGGRLLYVQKRMIEAIKEEVRFRRAEEKRPVARKPTLRLAGGTDVGSPTPIP
jgi:hypothetical protein